MIFLYHPLGVVLFHLERLCFDFKISLEILGVGIQICPSVIFFGKPYLHLKLGLHSFVSLLCQDSTLYTPQNVENFSVGMNPNEDIGNRDKLKVGFFCVRKEYFRLPNDFDQIGISQIECFSHVLMGQSGIEPTLTQIHIRHIIL